MKIRQKEKEVKNQMRQWEFIAEECRKNEWHGASRIAHKIDQIIQFVYVDLAAPAWAQFLEEEDKTLYDCSGLISLAGNTDYCTACSCAPKGRADCASCLFAALAGICTSDRSLYGDFIKTVCAEAAERPLQH